MTSKFIVKIVRGQDKGSYFKAAGRGITVHREEAHEFVYLGHLSEWEGTHLLVDKPDGTFIDIQKHHRLIPIVPFDTAEPQPYGSLQD